MIDSKAKRAAALGYGLSFLLVLPPAHGAISIEDAGHALSAYRFNMPATEPPPTMTLTGQYQPVLSLDARSNQDVALDAAYTPVLGVVGSVE